MVFDDLEVRVGADTADFSRGINRAQDSLGELDSDALQTAAALQVLQGRADEAGDEMSQIGRKASSAAAGLGAAGGTSGSTAGAFSALAASTEGLSLSFGSLTSSLSGTVLLLGAVGSAATALVSTLVPLAAVVGTLTAGAGALAAAFGGIVGSGILAFGKQQAEQNKLQLSIVNSQIESLKEKREALGRLDETERRELSTLKERKDELEDQITITDALGQEFKELRAELASVIIPFGRQFIPLIEEGINALPRLLRAVLDSVGGVEQFTRSLRQLGRFAFRVIPQVTETIFNLARRALPIFKDFINFVTNNATSAFQGMINSANQIGPLLIQIGQEILNTLPAFDRLGRAVLENLLPALRDMSVGLANLLTEENIAKAQRIQEQFSRLFPEIRKSAVATGRLTVELAELLAGANENKQFIGDLKVIFGGLADAISFAADSLEAFNEAFDSLPEFAQNAIGGAATQAIPGGSLVELGEDIQATQQPGIERPRGQETVVPNQQTNIQVEVTGDTGVISDVTAQELQELDRRSQRLRNRGNPG